MFIQSGISGLSMRDLQQESYTTDNIATITYRITHLKGLRSFMAMTASQAALLTLISTVSLGSQQYFPQVNRQRLQGVGSDISPCQGQSHQSICYVDRRDKIEIIIYEVMVGIVMRSETTVKTYPDNGNTTRIECGTVGKYTKHLGHLYGSGQPAATSQSSQKSVMIDPKIRNGQSHLCG